MAMKKKFDAVAESLKWRIATGKKLSGMTEEERLTYLNQGVAEKLQALRKGASTDEARQFSQASHKQPAHV